MAAILQTTFWIHFRKKNACIQRLIYHCSKIRKPYVRISFNKELKTNRGQCSPNPWWPNSVTHTNFPRPKRVLNCSSNFKLFADVLFNIWSYKGLNKMAAILQTTNSKAFFVMQIIVFLYFCQISSELKWQISIDSVNGFSEQVGRHFGNQSFSLQTNISAIRSQWANQGIY